MVKKTKSLHAGVIGTGPVGMTLAVHLREAGCSVSVCDSDRVKLARIRQEGIVFEDEAGRRCIRMDGAWPTAAEFFRQDFDLIFVALKTYQTAEALAGLPAGSRALVVGAQNGIDTEAIVSGFAGEARTARMVLNFGANLTSANSVRRTFFVPPNYIAALDPAGDTKTGEVAALLSGAGLTTEAVSAFALTKYTWEKTILNAALSPLCGIGRFTIAEAMAFADTTELVEQIIYEAVEVAEAENIRFPDDFIRNCLRYLKKGGNHFPSLAADLMNGRQTEIDYMNGKIVEYGRKHYIRTPLNLAMVNMVKAMTQKNILKEQAGAMPPAAPSLRLPGAPRTRPSGNCYLGIDLGSAYTKFAVADDGGRIVFRHMIKTLNREKVAVKHILAAIHDEFPVRAACATGHGRKYFPDADIIKTEIHCAAAGAGLFVPGAKNILDIGGEDIKVIRCDAGGQVENFYLNDKCAAGTGAFLTEIAERTGIEVGEMSGLAAQSEEAGELNSFCTVFAKTEVMKWIFDGRPLDSIARGIYLSIGNRVAKMQIDPALPVVMIGGTIAHHPYLKTVVEERTGGKVTVPPEPQYAVSLGAALIAREHWKAMKGNSRTEVSVDPYHIVIRK